MDTNNLELTPEDRLQLKNTLLDMLDELSQHSEEAKKTLQNVKKEDSWDQIDRASFESARSVSLRFQEREHKLRKKICFSLERLEQGIENICQECGASIGRKRLLARPVTTYCIDCKEQQERQERSC